MTPVEVHGSRSGLERMFDVEGPAGPTTWVAGLAGIATIALLDYLSGTEFRLFVLYYVPVSLVAWRAGRVGALAASVLASLGWLVANQAAGLTYSRTDVWVVNTLTQALSFAVVGILIAVVHDAVRRERSLARTDGLTGLLNRTGFLQEADRIRALCMRGGRPVTLAWIDLDGFKAVNDRLGHAEGDRVLRVVADVIREAVRPSDIAARMGGDEFVVFFPELESPEAAVTLERLRRAIEEHLKGSEVAVSGSVGGVTFNGPLPLLDAALREGDACMYAAKKAGKNRVELRVIGGAAGE